FSTRSGNTELHSGLPCSVAPGSLDHLPCPSLPRCPPCSIPGHLLRPMSASVFWVPFPASVGMYRGWNQREIQKFKNNVILFHIDFVPSALSGALPAFLLFFL
ncbi:unnamed protein product, partial [Staurois parvus]